MAKEGLVPRPAKKSEYELRFATAGAQKGWRDLVATMRNVMADTWDFLTTTPATRTPTNYPTVAASRSTPSGYPRNSFSRFCAVNGTNNRM